MYIEQLDQDTQQIFNVFNIKMRTPRTTHKRNYGRTYVDLNFLFYVTKLFESLGQDFSAIIFLELNHEDEGNYDTLICEIPASN